MTLGYSLDSHCEFLAPCDLPLQLAVFCHKIGDWKSGSGRWSAKLFL